MRRRISTQLDILWLKDDNLSSTLEAVTEVLGSSAHARQVLARRLQLFNAGSSNIRRNWAALLGLLGGDAATAREAVLTYPGLLRLDMGRDVFQQRIQFYQQECGASLEQVLNSYVESSLVHVGPRVAWAKRHLPAKPDKPISLRTWTRPDKECMENCGVPLEGYTEFKAAWLASEEGREWCKYEAGSAAKGSATGTEDSQ